MVPYSSKLWFSWNHDSRERMILKKPWFSQYHESCKRMILTSPTTSWHLASHMANDLHPPSGATNSLRTHPSSNRLKTLGQCRSPRTPKIGQDFILWLNGLKKICKKKKSIAFLNWDRIDPLKNGFIKIIKKFPKEKLGEGGGGIHVGTIKLDQF